MIVSVAFSQTGRQAEHAVKPEEHSEMGTVAGSGQERLFPPFDSSTYPSQLLWLSITFGFFYFFLKRVVLPRIGSLLEVRSDRIAWDLDQAARMKDEADAVLAAYKQELSEASKRAGAIAREAHERAKASAQAEQRRIEDFLQLKLSGTERHIAEIKAEALTNVGMVAEEVTRAIIMRLGGPPEITDTEIQAAVKAVLV